MLTFASEIREKVSPRRIEVASNKQHYRAVMTSFWRVQRRRDASCYCNAAYERSKPLSNAEDNKNINNLNIGGLVMTNRVKRLPVSAYEHYSLGEYPNFHKSGSIRGMKKLYYDNDALLVRCGNYIYNVSSNPAIYEEAY